MQSCSEGQLVGAAESGASRANRSPCVRAHVPELLGRFNRRLSAWRTLIFVP